MIPTPVIVIKKCSECNVVKPVTAFSINRMGKYGKRHNCKICQRVRRKQYYQKNTDTEKSNALRWQKNNPERNVERRRAFYLRHKEKLNKQQREWRAENREKENARNKKYRDENKESIREYNREWKRKNPDKVMQYRLKRKEIGYEPYTLKTKCGYCGSGERLTLDHIIPVNMVGEHNINKEHVASKENYETACISCNSSKQARIPLAEEYLDRIEKLLEYDIRDEILASHCWIPPISKLSLF